MASIPLRLIIGYLIASRVAEDFDDDWLIFKSGVSKMSVHPTHSEWKAKRMTNRVTTIALMCEDMAANRVAYSFRRNCARCRSDFWSCAYFCSASGRFMWYYAIQIYNPFEEHGGCH
ncbi:MAG: hypothetical protein ACJ8KF_16625 [Chthoniobacterales bacterium]